MLSFNFARWLRSALRSRPKTISKSPRIVFQLEELEPRETPATLTWTGLGGNTLWSNPGNWSSSDVLNHPIPIANSLENLSFPTLAPSANHTLVNDLANLTISNINIADNNYILTGSSLTLGSPTVSGSGTIHVSSGVGNDIQLDLQFAGPNGSKQFLIVDTGNDVNMGLTISGHISGVTGSELTKQGVGSLALTKDNSVVGGGFSGPFSMDKDAGIVELTNANALGATSTSEVQTLTLSGLTTGKFNLKFNGSTPTADLDFASTAAQVQAALNGLSTVAPGTVNVIRSGNTFFITFSGGTLAGTNVPQLVATGVSGTLATPNTLTQGGAFAGTTVGQNSQILLNNIVGGTIFEPILLNDAGVSQDGAIRNMAGSNIWGGSVTLGIGGSNTVFLGTDAGTTLLISGQINDAGASQGVNLTKRGSGTLVLTNANTYRGLTTIDNGLVTIRNPQALGTGDGTAATGTIITSDNIKGVGGLQIDGAAFAGGGFTVVNELLTLNAAGTTGLGSLYNLSGNNTWAGNVILGSVVTNNSTTVTIGTNTGTDLTISGSPTPAGTPSARNDVSSATPFPLLKSGAGRLILPTESPNYTSSLTINAGTVVVRDSLALGFPSTSTNSGTTVNYNTSLVLEVDGLVDSVTGNTKSLQLAERLTLFGTGFNNAGALRSSSGVNSYVSGTGITSATWSAGVVTITTSIAHGLTVGQSVLISGMGPAGYNGWFLVASVANNTTFTYALAANPGIATTLGTAARSDSNSNLITVSPETQTIVGASWNAGVATITTQNGHRFQVNQTIVISGMMPYGYNGSYVITGVTANTFSFALATNPGVATNFGTASVGAAIGVDADPAPTPTDSYFTNDYSLTVYTGIGGSALQKVGAGQMILPNTKSYSGVTTISQGWITIRDENALGPYSGASVGDTASPAVTVMNGAALHLMPGFATITGVAWSAGSATITTLLPHGFLVGQSVVIAGMVPAGFNGSFIITAITSTSFTYDLAVNPGVASTFGTAALDTATITNATWAASTITYTTSIPHGFTVGQTVSITGMDNPAYNGVFVITSVPTTTTFTVGLLLDPGVATTFGTVTRQFDFIRNLILTGNGITHSYGLINQQGALETLGGDIIVGGPVMVSKGNPRGSTIQLNGDAGIGVEQLPSFATGSMVITAPIGDGSNPGGFTKLGSRRMTVQNNNSFSGSVTIQEGVLRAQNDMAFGQQGGSVIVQNGGASDIQRLVVTGSFVTDAFQLTYDRTSTIVGAFWNAGVATITTSLPHLYAVGETVTIAGVGPVGFNGTFVITSVTATTFTYALAVDPGTATTFGTAVISTTTPQILFGTSAPALQTILNNTPSFFPAGGSVTVQQSNNNTYYITFLGTLGNGVNASELRVTGLFGAANAYVTTMTQGDGTALELVKGLTQYNGGISAGLQIWGEHLFINGNIGNSTLGANDTPLTITPGEDDLWRGPVSLNASATITIPQTSRLTLFGTIDDAGNPSASGSDITFIGGGELSLFGANTYRGNTNIDQGIVTIENALALGTTGVQEVQTVTIPVTATSWNLIFNGSTATPDFTDASTEADVQAALQALTTIGGVGGTATVTRLGNVYTITFGGTLTGFNQPLLIATVTTGSGTIGLLATTEGAGATIVAAGAQLQLQGGITVAGEPLLLSGSGVNSAGLPNVPLRWFQTGPAAIGNGQTPGNMTVSGRLTSVFVDPTDENVIYVTSAGGGAWKTVNNGITWVQIFDHQDFISNPVSLVETAGIVVVTTTAPHGYVAGQTVVITGASDPGYNGTFQIIDAPTANTFRYAVATFPLAPATGGTAVVTVPIFAGSIAIAPSNPHILYLGTGEGNNTGDSYYGTGVYRSLDGGLTWSLLENPYTTNVVSNPIQGQVINKILVDPSDPNRIYVATSDRGVFSSLAANPTGVASNNVASASWDSTTGLAAVTLVNPPTFSVGQQVAFSGMVPTIYNGTVTVSAIVGNTVFFPLTPAFGSITNTLNAANWAGTATLTTATPHGLAVGNLVTISGMVPLAYNGTFVVTAATANTFSFALAVNPGPVVTFGTMSAPIVDAITAANWTGIATLTTTSPHGLIVGEQVTIAGMVPGGYNGLVTVTAVAGNTFSYALGVNPGAVVVLGSLTVPAITNESWNAGVATITLASPHGYNVGNLITIAGSSFAPYNGTFFITAVAGNQLSFGLATDPTLSTTNGVTSNPILSTTFSAGIVTITTGSPHGFSVGQQVNVTGMTPASFNGTFVVTAATATTFSFALASAGTTTRFIVSVAYGQPGPGQMTYTTGSPNTLAVGDVVTVTGFTPAAYNGTFTITAINGNDFTFNFPFANPGAITTFGTVAVPNAVATTLGNIATVPTAPGVWRFDATGQWINLTAIVSTNRASVPSILPGPPNSASPAPIPRTPGPDDNYTVSFPQSNASWSDIALSVPVSININSLTWNAGVVNVSATGSSFLVGQEINISGMVPNAYNGSYLVTSSSANSFTFAMATNPGVVTNLGSVRLNGTRILYAALATSSGSGNNGVYRLKEPDINSPTLPFYWLAGDTMNGPDARNMGWVQPYITPSPSTTPFPLGGGNIKISVNETPVNEIQTITISPVAGQPPVTAFALTYNGNISVTLNAPFSAAAIQAALNTTNMLGPWIGTGNNGVIVTNPSPGIFVINFANNDVAGANVLSLGLTGVVGTSISVTTTLQGTGPTVYATVSSTGGSLSSIQKSVDGGRAWQAMGTPARDYLNTQGLTDSVIIASPTSTITSATWNNGSAIIGVSNPRAFAVGSTVVITGMSPSGYNGTFTVTSVSSTSFTYSVAAQPNAAVLGTATNPNLVYIGGAFNGVDDPRDFISSVWESNDGGNSWGDITTGTLAITGAAWNAGVVTITTAQPHTYSVGQSITISGMTPAGYNGTYVITGVTKTTFTYILVANPGVATAFGTVPTGVHTGNHGMAIDLNGRLLLANDGGIWRLQNNTVGSILWNDLNGNLAVSQVNGVAQNPSNLNLALTGSNDNGTAAFTGPQSALQTDVGDGGEVVYDPKNPNIAYHVRNIRLISNILSASVSGTLIIVNTPSPHGLVTGESVTVNNIPFNGGLTSVSVIIHVITPTQFTYSWPPTVPGAIAPLPGGTVTANFNTSLMKSLDGGQTWASILDGTGIYFPFAIDPNNTSRIVVGMSVGGSNQLLESTNGGTRTAALFTTNTTFANLSSQIPNSFFSGKVITGIALATYQGTFSNAGFTNVNDKGANSLDPDTIYITNGTDVILTKDHGLNWVTRTPPGITATTISDIKVDPSNRDTVYVTLNGFSGAAGISHILKSTDAGITWTDISDGLPDVPAWKLAIDSRTNTLYLGNDIGVYQLAGSLNITAATWNAGVVTITTASPNTYSVGQPVTVSGMFGPGYNGTFIVTSATATTFTYALATDPGVAATFGNVIGAWTRLGIGLPNVQVKDVELSADLNILSIGTYGRSMYQFYLNDVKADSGALRAVSGNNVWTGPILLAADTVITVNGSQALQSGLAAAQLNVSGVISDADFQGNHKLTKDGLGDAIFSAPNTYGGLTEIKGGVLVVQNSQALGDYRPGGADITDQGGTIVDAGAALVMRSDLALEGVQLNGDGASQSNQHFTGALRNASNNNTFTGTLYLNTDTTIGVDSGSSLTIGTSGFLPGPGTISGAFGFDKELTGTLVLGSANTYSGITTVNQGILQIQHSTGLGDTSGGTVVLDGAQLQIATPTAGPNAGIPVDVGGVSISDASWSGGVVTITTYSDHGYSVGQTVNISGMVPAGYNGTYVITSATATSFTYALASDPGLATTLGIAAEGPVSISNASWSAGVVTVTTASNHGYAVGQRVNISGMVPAGYNGTVVITGVTATTFTYALAVNPGAATTFGNVIGGESLDISGTGINNNGALVNVNGDNAWSGPITFDYLPGFSPVTAPANYVLINVAPTSNLTIDGVINEDTSKPASPVAFGLTKIGGGRLILTKADTYSEQTNVNEGVIRITNANALGTFGPGAAATNPLVHDYEFNGTVPAAALADSLGGPSMQELVPGSGTFTGTRYDFLRNEGLFVNNALANPANYTIEMRFNFTDLTSTEWTRILDYKNRAVDAGLYQITDFSTRDGALQEYPNFTGANNVFTAGTDITITLTRNATTNQVSAYANGIFQFSFIDSSFESVFTGPNGIIHFFTDNLGTAPNEASPGSVDSIRIFNTPLTSAQVLTAFLGGVVTGSGTTQTNTIVHDGAALEVAGGINVPAEDLVLNGTGINGTGALRNVADVNTYAGAVTLASNSSIGADANTQLSITGVVQDLAPVPVPAPTLTKVGTGTLVFTGPNAYRGFTFINEGVLNIQNNTSLGLNANEVQQLAVAGTSGSYTLNFQGQITNPILPGATALQVQNELNALSTINAGGGSVSVTQAGNIYLVTFDNGPLAGINQIPLIAIGINGTSVTVTTPQDGGSGSGTSVASGATLQLQGNINVSLESLTINGLGFNNAGALENLSGTNTWSNPVVTLGSDSSIGSTGTAVGDKLILNTAITESSPNLGVTKVGPGTAQYTGDMPNAYTGLTNVIGGKLELNKSNAVQTITIPATVTSFTLTLGANTTAPITYTTLTATDLAAISAALNTPAMLGAGGTATVTSAGFGAFTITFGGTLAGTNLPGLKTTTLAGNGIINVASGAILGNLTVGQNTPFDEVQTISIPATVTSFSLTFNGNTTAVPIPLTGLDSTDIAAISAALNTPAILGVGGSVVVTSTAPNVFTITFGGTLAGANQPQITATNLAGTDTIASATTVEGLPFVADADIVQLLQRDQIADTSTVLINHDGFLNLDGFSEQFGPLTIVDGHVKVNNVGGSGSLTIPSLDMTGGLIDNAGATSILHLTGNLQATSSANSQATITGAAGTLDLTSSTGSVVVNDGPKPSDLVIGNSIIGVPDLFKSGAGRMEMSSGGQITMLATINNGDVQVDTGATAANIEVNSATSSVSGTGIVGKISGVPTPAAAAVGTVNPGANGLVANTGILHSQDVVWGPATTFFVNLDNPDTPLTQPVPGTEYDQLAVTGNASLGGAKLDGTVSLNVQIGDSFTILTTTGQVSGQLFGNLGATTGLIAQDGFVFINGVKFQLHYNYAATNGSVVLTRVLMSAVSVITAVPDSTPGPNFNSTSVYGQLVTYTVTITPEPGAGIPVSGATATFIIDGGAQSTTVPLTVTAGVGAASLDPQTFFSIVWQGNSTHTIDTQLNAYGFNISPATQFTQTVNKASTAIALTATPTNATYGDPVLLSAVVSAVSPGNGGPTNGVLNFYVDSISPAHLLGAGVLVGNTYTLTTGGTQLSVGTHSFIAAFASDTNLLDKTVTITNFVVSKRPTAITSVTTGGSLIYGAPMTLTVIVSATGTGTPGSPVGTVAVTSTGVTFGTPVVTQPTPTTTQYVFSFSAPSAALHNLTVTFTATATAGSINFSNSSTTSSFTNLKADTAVALTSSVPAGAVGGSTIYTATINTLAPSATPVNAGTVTFVNITTGQTLGTANVTVVGGVGKATLSSTLNTPAYVLANPNIIRATYNPPASNANFNPSSTSDITSPSGNITQLMLRAATMAYSASPNPSVFGQPVTVGVTVTGTGTAPPTPTGTVRIFDGATLVTSGTLSGGSVNLTLNGLALGAHNLTITYTDDLALPATYGSISINRTQTVAKSPTTTAVTSNSPIVFGQASNFTATVTAAFGGAPTLAVVTFFDNGVAIGSGSFTSSTSTSMTFSFTPSAPMAVGTHVITATYVGSANFLTSTSPALSYVVSPSTTTTTLSSNSPTQFGQGATFNAHVDSTGGITPTGNVTFYDGAITPANAIGTSPLGLTGDTSFTIFTLSTASHFITAVFNATTNFGASASNTITHLVNRADTSTTVTSDAASGAVYGQIVTFSIMVVATSGGQPGIPTGFVSLMDGGVPVAGAGAIPLVNGVATYAIPSSTTPTLLSVATHAFSAVYSATTNFAGSTSVNFNQNITAAPTTTALSSIPAFWPLNQPTTLFATITANAPSTATPTGSVAFTIDGVLQAPITLSGGQASLTHTFTSTGTPNYHTVSVEYTPDTINFSAVPGPQASDTQEVRLGTSMTLGTSLPDGALENEAITFYGFVSGVAGPPSNPTPTGAVNFFDNGVLIGTGIVNPATGIATLTLSGGLSIGNHNITAKYVGDGTFNPAIPATALSQMVVRTRIKGRLIF